MVDSYGVIIANAGDTVSPLDLLNLTVTQHKKDAVVVDEQDPSIDSWLMVGICGYYRTASANDQGSYIREQLKFLI